jgi:predicted regulator of Ras-like GTPase activity (Roadblock/LC7/MglB family)
MATMANALSTAMSVTGAMAVAVVDMDSGMALATAGGGVDLEVAAAGNTEVVRAKMRVMQELDLGTEIEDILITLGTQYHLIRPIKSKGAAGLFIYYVLDRGKANLAMARHKLTEVANTITI